MKYLCILACIVLCHSLSSDHIPKVDYRIFASSANTKHFELKEPDYRRLRAVLNEIKKSEWITYRLTYGYAWRNLDSFGRAEPTALVQEITGEEKYLISFLRQPSHDLPSARKLVHRAEGSAYLTRALKLAEDALDAFETGHQSVVDRWIQIEVKSSEDKHLFFQVAYM
ncbi:MAG: hypothetical protein AAF546_11530 [Verrucomicrobiota bacterium]